MNKFKNVINKVFHSWLWLIIPLLLLDQLTKMWAHFSEWNLTLIPNFLHLTYVRNTGAAWSILRGNMGLLAFISALAAIAIFVAFIKYQSKLSTFKKILFAVILAGTLGNFIDRAFYKLLLGSEGVVDFIHFQFGSYDFPIFNVADILLTVGIITFAVLMTIEDFKDKHSKKEVSEPEEGKKEEDEDANHQDSGNV